MSSTGNSTGVGGARGNGAVDYGKKEDSFQINHKWSNGYKKASRGHNNRNLVVEYCAEQGMFGQSIHHYIVCRDVETKERWCVVPNTMGQYRKIEKLMGKWGDRKTVYLKTQGRARKGHYSSNNVEYRIAADRVKVVKVEKQNTGTNVVPLRSSHKGDNLPMMVKGAGGGMVTRAKFLHELKIAGGSCLNCDEVFGIEDAEDITWVGKKSAVICKTCSGDPFVMQCASQM